MSPTLVVLAAGMGSRFGGLKQMRAVSPSGATLLDYSVYDAIRAGFGATVFVIRREIEEDFRTLVLDRLPKDRMEYRLAFQELNDLPKGVTLPSEREKPWGTAHAVWCAREQLHGAFAVINADDFYGKDAFYQLSRFLTSTPDAYAMVAYALANTLSEQGYVSRGVCEVDSTGHLRDIVEHTKIVRQDGAIVDIADPEHPVLLSAEAPVSMNCWALPHSFMARLDTFINNFFTCTPGWEAKESYIPYAVLSAGGENISLLRAEAEWCGMTYPGDVELTCQRIAQYTAAGEYPARLWS